MKPFKGTHVSPFLFVGLMLAGVAAGSDHRGNVFVAGDAVRASVPETWAAWRAIDVDGNDVGRGTVHDGVADLGRLPIGYFEILEENGTGSATAAVVAEIEPVEDTPIALDAAIAWFYAEPKQIRDACRLCRLAGVRWVRDRLSWPEIETADDTWAGETRYERAMQIQHEMGLKVLQVNHIAPAWAGATAARFPEDLRLVYDFYRGLARRWNGLADAIEPWNEPDIELFGGHTGCEIASFQKAAYLGLKAGNPAQPACGLCFAIDRAETLDEFAANEVYPYFDQYHLHHYIRLPEYSRAYGRHRAVCGGRPMWTTEFNLPVWWADEKTKEPSADDLRVQGYRVGKVFAQALYEGSQKAFYFILGDYVERNLQYGLVHGDLTPRPAYVAFAAVGRLLNGARPLGRVELGDEKLKAYLFRAFVDGAERETLVAWSETKATTVTIRTAEAAYDYLGRKLPEARELELSRATLFVVLPRGGSNELTIVPPPVPAAWRNGTACPVVLQLVGNGDFHRSAFQLDASNELQLVAYNFGVAPAGGKLRVEGADVAADELTLGPGERIVQTIRANGAEQITARLELGELGPAIVSARVANATGAD